MEPLDFLRTVLPSPGHGLYCAFNGVKKQHAFRESIEELLPLFTAMVERKADAYFALATFGTDEGRTKDNARYIRALFIDMDGYEAPQQAWVALRDFLKATGLWGLGKPYAVISGGGLHAYWPFTRDLTIAEWEPIARNMKRLCKQESLRIDPVVTADAARILRPPGTFNFKPVYPEPVEVIVVKEGSTFDPEGLGAAIAALLPVETPQRPDMALSLPGIRIDAPPLVDMELAKQAPQHFKLVEQRGCQQIKFYREHAADEGMEPLWRSIVSVAKVCVDGWDAAVELTALRPSFVPKLADRWSRASGPHFCATFEDENPGGCKDCPHSAWIKTPAQLARDNNGTTAPIETVVTTQAESDVEPQVVVVTMPECPKGFQYDRNVGLRVEKDEVTDSGDEIVTSFPLLTQDLWVQGLLETPEGHFINLAKRRTRTEAPVSFTLPAEAITSKDLTLKHLSRAGIIVHGIGLDELLYKYMRGAVGAAAERAADKTPYHFGWQEDGTFVSSGMVFKKGVAPQKVPMIGLENLLAATHPKGTLAGWREYVEVSLVKKGLYKQLAAFLGATAAPLMRYTESAGMTIHCCSKQTQSGKTLSIDLVSSVWGDQEKYRIGSGSSANAVKQRLGLLHSLPLPMDEITEQTRKDPEWFANHLLSMTDGKGKERMESGTNRERVNLTSWSTVAIMTSNTRAMNFLLNGRKHSSDGELMRLIEFKMPIELKWTDEERQFKFALKENHGVAGCAFAQWLVDNADSLDGWVKEAVNWVRVHMGLQDQERHWTSLLGASVVTARGLKECGAVTLPLDAILKAFKAALDDMREEMKAAQRSPEEVVWEFIRANSGQMIVVQKVENSSNITSINKEFPGLGFRSRNQELSSGKMPIMGRADVDVIPEHTDYHLPHELLRKHFGEYGYDLREALETLSKSPEFVHVVSKCRPDLLAGTKLGAGLRMNCATLRVRNETAESAGVALTSSLAAA